MTIWTREGIATLKEDDLTRDVLVPLFRAMGYRDVRFHGGGALEQGKDLVMWREEPIRGRINIAVVVKATAITGQAAAGIVVTQLRQAFGKPFLATDDQSEQQVHECFVVTPREIKKEGTNSLVGLISNETFSCHVTFIDGKRLWELVEKHLGSKIAVPRLFEAYRDFRQVSAGYDIGVDLNGEVATFKVKHGPAPEPVLVQPTFPATPEGEAGREAFDRLMKTGESVEIAAASVEGLPAHDLLETLGMPLSEARIRLSSAGEPLSGALILTAADDDSVVFDHIVFSVTGGTEKVRFSNSDQGLPFTIENTATFNDDMPPEGQFHYAFSAVGWSANWLLLQQKSMRVLSKGCRISFRELATGIEHGLGTVSAGFVNASTPQFIEVVRDLAWIESRVKHPIIIPERVFFTSDDLENIAFVHAILTTGHHRLESASFTVQPPPEHRAKWSEHLQKKKVSNFALRLAMSSWPVLDTMLPLGPVEYRGSAVELASKIGTAEAIEAVERGDPIEVEVAPVGGKRFVASYLWWHKK